MYSISAELKEKYVRLLEKLCLMETPSGNKKNIDLMVDVIENFAIDSGFATERFPFERAGDFLLIKLNPEREEKPVLLMAHMDTVHKVGAFGEPAVTIDGDVMHGPGVMDCKGGVVTGLCILEVLKYSGRPINLLLTSDEEVNGLLSGEKGYEIIMNMAGESAAVFNLEPGKPGEVTVGRKGILHMSVSVTGVSAHAGNAYFSGASAIKEAAHAILEIEAMSEKDGITFNCGTVNGGTVSNTVPDYCEIAVDIRVSTMEEMQRAEDAMRAVCRHSVIENTKRSVSVVSRRPPMELAENNMRLFDIWNASARALGMAEFKAIKRGGGSDAAYATLVGVPTLCSCAMEGWGEHTLNETADLSTFADRVSLISETIGYIFKNNI